MPSDTEVVEFSTEIYSSNAVQAARDAYAAFMDVSLNAESEAKVVAHLSDPDLRDAFCNHVLFETIRLHRAAEGQQ